VSDWFARVIRLQEGLPKAAVALRMLRQEGRATAFGYAGDVGAALRSSAGLKQQAVVDVQAGIPCSSFCGSAQHPPLGSGGGGGGGGGSTLPQVAGGGDLSARRASARRPGSASLHAKTGAVRNPKADGKQLTPL
jgi:hypothetical protein